MKNKKVKLIIPSILAIIGSIGIATGTTYSLFTSESTNNITISSGKVNVTSSLSLTNVYSPKSIDSEGNDLTPSGENGATYTNGETTGTFINGGTVSLSGNTLLLNNMTPGDSVTLSLSITNNSSINAKYRYSILKDKDMGLFDGLSIVENNNDSKATTLGSYISKWNTITNSDKDLVTKSITISLPSNATNEYMNTTTSIAIKVEAIQGNANSDVVEVSTTEEAQNALDNDLSGKTIYFKKGTYNTLYIRATATSKGDTTYYNNGSPSNYSELSEEQEKDLLTNLNKDSQRAYVRTIKNVTFMGESGVNIKGILADYSTGSETGDTDLVTLNSVTKGTNNSSSYINYENVSFVNLNFTESMYIGEWDNSRSLYYKVKNIDISNCSFTTTYDSNDKTVKKHALTLASGGSDESLKKFALDIGTINISNSSFDSNNYNTTGIYIKNICGNFNFKYNNFHDNAYNGIQFSDTNHSQSKTDVNGISTIDVSNNIFINNKDRALKFSTDYSFKNGSTCNVENNAFYLPLTTKSNGQFIGNDETTDLSVKVGKNKYYDRDGKDLGELSATNTYYFAGCVAKS